MHILMTAAQVHEHILTARCTVTYAQVNESSWYILG